MSAQLKNCRGQSAEDLIVAECLLNMAGNGLGIAAVGDFENRQLNICTKVDSSTDVQLLLSAPIAAIPC